jgi:hypothetical protein
MVASAMKFLWQSRNIIYPKNTPTSKLPVSPQQSKKESNISMEFFLNLFTVGNYKVGN